MTATAVRRDPQRVAKVLVWVTLVWNVVEGVIAVALGQASGSIALIGFGFDSGIEVFVAVVVLWRLRGLADEREETALRCIGAGFFLLAGYVSIQAVVDLVSGSEPSESLGGIALAAASVIVMPVLALAKARVGRQMGSAAVVAESTETMLCAYLSAVLLVGLVLNSTVGWWWADPVAAIAIAAVALREGREAWRGDTCCD